MRRETLVLLFWEAGFSEHSLLTLEQVNSFASIIADNERSQCAWKCITLARDEPELLPAARKFHDAIMESNGVDNDNDPARSVRH